MNETVALIERLRGLNRGIKFAILLIAAWAPFMFPSSPWVVGALMAAMTALFFLLTAPKRSSISTSSKTPAGNIDAEP